MNPGIRIPAELVPQGAKVMGSMPFFYNLGSGSISVAAGATATGVLQLAADSVFAWDKLTVYATIANAAFTSGVRPVPSCTLLMTETSSGRQYMDQATPIPAITGNGELPYILPVATWWKPNSSISWSIVNFDAAVTYLLRVTCHGTKVYLS